LAYACRQSPELQEAPGVPQSAPPFASLLLVFMKPGALQAPL
jgi:hypothetical protein